MNSPLVSICIPTYQGELFLQEALESAARQTYSPLEIVVSDAQSTDSTREIVKDFAATTTLPIRFYTCYEAGISANLNFCISRSNGQYIKWLFQDDLLEPDCVEKMMAVAQEDSLIGMVFCPRKLLYDTSVEMYQSWARRYAHLHKSWSDLRRINEGTELLGDRQLWVEPINKVGEPPCVLLKKSILGTVGGYDVKFKQALDIDFNLRILASTRVGFVDEQLVTIRLHPGQSTWETRKEGARRKEPQFLLQTLRSATIWPHLHPRLRWQIRWRNDKIFALLRGLARLVRPLVRRGSVRGS